MLPPERLDLIEGLGDNCELGSVLRHYGHVAGSMFRWVAAEPTAVFAAIERDFQGTFLFENLVPATPRMVRDSASSMAFHTQMLSVMRQGRLIFLADEAERRRIYETERRKFDYFARKFRAKLQVPDVVYVIRHPGPLPPERLRDFADILERRRRGCPFRLVHVTQAEDPGQCGRVISLGGHLHRAFVGRLAQIGELPNAEFGTWHAILEQLLPEAAGGSAAA